TNADEHAAGWAHAQRPRLLEELSVLSGEPWRSRGRHTHERTPDVLVPIDADEVTQIRREAGTSEVPPIAAFDSPVLVRGEVDVERDLSAAAGSADMRGGVRRIAIGPHEVDDRFGPRARPVP